MDTNVTDNEQRTPSMLTNKKASGWFLDKIRQPYPVFLFFFIVADLKCLLIAQIPLVLHAIIMVNFSLIRHIHLIPLRKSGTKP